MRISTAVTLMLILASVLCATPPALAEAKVPLGHVEVRGSGPVPMVLIAGPTLDWRYWEGFMDRNAEAYTMYAVTLPGMSGSRPMPTPRLWRPRERKDRENPPLGTPWLDNAIDAIVDMMHEQGVENAVVMGHAMGGVLAMRLGIEHPELVSAVISLEGPVAFPMARPMTKKERAEQAQFMFDTNMRAIPAEQWAEQMEQWTLLSVSDPKIARFVTSVSLDTDKDVVIRYMVEHRMTDLTDEIGKLHQPLLAIFSNETLGGVDTRKQKDFAPAWHEDVRFHDFDDISFFYNLQRPERFDAEIAAFIKEQVADGGDRPGEGGD
ncbi:MAG: alpha/beta hydrolase [Phycisphaeraceae bacterium]|nr:alpha/beta hydrolase [Phycisphaeraceae bacterium]